MRIRRRRDGGFTLVEVMIALAIIGITAVALGWAFRHRVMRFHPAGWMFLLVGGLTYLPALALGGEHHTLRQQRAPQPTAPVVALTVTTPTPKAVLPPAPSATAIKEIDAPEEEEMAAAIESVDFGTHRPECGRFRP